MLLRLRLGKSDAGPHKKKAEQEQRTLVFGEQSAFSLRPMAVSTSAPVGQTPVLKVKLTRDHLSAMSDMTPEGRSCLQMQDHSYKGPDVVRFLPLLTREISGKLLVIRDGAPLHRCQAVTDVVSKGEATRLHLEPLPADAPEWNPPEGVGNLFKRVERKNRCCLDVPHIQQELRRAKERLRHRTSILSQGFAHAGNVLSFSWFRSIKGRTFLTSSPRWHRMVASQQR
ncbi:MAG TPA: transposase [Ktedonobacteraceae bacterium]